MNVSIVIPVYNEADSIGDCLSAISRQSVRPLEVIVVDNGSTDNSRRIAEQFPFVRLINESRRGIVHARNRGFDAARGDIIARIDADTILPPDWVAHIASFYAQAANSAQAFSGGADFYDVPLPGAASWLYNLLAFDFNRLLIGHATLWGSNMALTRQQWQAVRLAVCPHDDIHEDLDLAIHLHRAGYGIFYDRQFRIGAQLRRVHATKRELWEYLQWWPRTLKRHRLASWRLCWLVACPPLFMLALALKAAEQLGMIAGKESLGTDRV